MNNKISILIALILSFSKYMSGQEELFGSTQNNFRKSEIFKEEINLENPDLIRLDAILFFLTNEERKKKNLSLVSYHPKLEEAAIIHCNSMREQNFFAHINPKSKKLKNPNERARFVGITNPYLAENIIETFVLQYKAGDPVYPAGRGVFLPKPNAKPIKSHTYLSLGETMLKAWMDSPQHKANILSKQALQLGCGTAIYLNDDFNGMPTVLSTQNFQLHEEIRLME